MSIIEETTQLYTISSPDKETEQTFLDRRGLCRKAIAHGSTVYGIAPPLTLTWSIRLQETVHSITSQDAWVVAATERSVSVIREGVVLISQPIEDLTSFAWISPQQLLLEFPSQLMLISHFEALLLLSTEERLHIQTLALPHLSDVTAFGGGDSKLRFVGLREGLLYTRDWSDGVWADEEYAIELPSEWYVDPEVGLHHHVVGDRTFLVCGATNDIESAVFWIDVCTKQLVCHYNIASRLLAITPLTPWKDGTVAMALAEKTPSTSCLTVIQVIIEDTMGLLQLLHPHVLYRIPIPEAVSVTLSPIEEAKGAFRIKFWSSVRDCHYQAFIPSSDASRIVSETRWYVAQNQNDQAEAFLQAEESQVVMSAMQDPYAHFNPTEIALNRLRHWLQHGSQPDEAATLLQRIAEGARQHPSGKQILMDAVDSLLNSSANCSLSDMMAGLSALATYIEEMNAQDDDSWKVRLGALRSKWTALETLDRIGGESISLKRHFSQIKSTRQLFSTLIEEKRFLEASKVCRWGLLPMDDIVRSILKIDGTVSPHLYIPMLRDLILPKLTINGELFAMIRAWSCAIADQLDETHQPDCDIQAAIDLLSCIEQATRYLSRETHASFSRRSPFVATIESERASPPGKEQSSSLDISRGSLNTSSSDSSPRRDKSKSYDVSLAGKPIPTILELGALRRGASKKPNHFPRSFEEYDGIEDNTEIKLHSARCLVDARKHGLRHSLISLRNFVSRGGAQYVVTELVRIMSKEAPNHHTRLETLTERIEPFCREFNTDRERAIFTYCEDFLSAKSTITVSALKEAASLARCCSSILTRCQIALSVIRAALRCGDSPEWLSDFSKEAIFWAASDSKMQLELEEASRLLTIDQIVVKYCGPGARQLFRVDNSLHAIRLLRFVTNQIERPSVVKDSLALCEAFHQFSEVHVGASILRHALLHHNAGLITDLLLQLIAYNSGSAQASLTKTLSYAEEILSCDEEERIYDRQLVLSHISKMLDCALDYFDRLDLDAVEEVSSYWASASVEKIRRDFLCILRLNEDHGVRASISTLRSHSFAYDQTCRLLRQNLSANFHTSCFSTNLAGVKRACLLLCAEDITIGDVIWLKAVSVVLCGDTNRTSLQVMRLLEEMGLLSCSMNAAFGQITLALALCKAAMRDADDAPGSGMEKINIAASLVRDRALLFHVESNLAAVVNLFAILDFVSQILTRADEGIGEQQDHMQRLLQMKAWQSRPTEDDRVFCQETPLSSLCLPLLHPSWYIGDGLLLSPSLALHQALVFSKAILFSDDQDNRTAELFEVLSESGAHFLSLRALCMWSSVCVPLSCHADHNLSTESVLDGFGSANFSLTERCLGGGGKGITNAKIDSELAVSFLLALPSKLAFKAFKACLPTAVKTHSFNRLRDLANVGICAASGFTNAYGSSVLPIGWKGQDVFLTQCAQFAKRAMWSIVLECHGVRFDAQRLDTDAPGNLCKGSVSQSIQYAKSLIPTLMEALSKSLCPSDVTTLSRKFAHAFGLPDNLVFEKHVELLLSPTFSKYVYQNINALEEVARISLNCITSQSVRAVVLRRCVLAVEKHQASNYDQIDLLLTLYNESLADLLKSSKFEEHDKDWLEYELDLIVRRRDVLTILSSFFQGEKESMRPCFTAFFHPLEETPSSVQSKVRLCSITGQKTSDDTFDPIAPLEKALREYPESGTVTALAPLCIPLGFPSGYIHARFLVVRFTDAKATGGCFPSFENDIVPVLDRLRSSKDKAELAEWCSNHYQNDSDRLKCLELALQSVMIASTEIERCLQTGKKTDHLKNLEILFLEKIKQISARKDALSDHLKAKAILKAALCSLTVSMSERIQQLLDILGDQPKESPEQLIGSLLEEGSLVAAVATLDNGVPTEQVRHLSSVVHSACSAVAEQHSHIIIAQHSHRLATKWLMHGDDNTEAGFTVEQPTKIPAKDHAAHEDASFVMDLTDLQTADDWAGSLGSDRFGQLNTEDEPFAIKPCSPREKSEYASQRAALRIAFVLAHQEVGDDECNDKENAGIATKGNALRPLKKDVLRRIDTSHESRSEEHIMNMSRELLRVAFAAGSSHSLVSEELNAVETNPRAATFAMRHRALRAAAVLCPQEALERVVRSDGLLTHISSSCFLRDCAYGSFVAKEIEEMGLPLPHDDLGRLSSMHYLSFARTLWRHHRGMRTSGRFLLLLLQMSLHDDETDPSFVEILLHEMARIQLPRTLLLASESLLDFIERFRDRTLYQSISRIRLLPPLLSHLSKDLASAKDSDLFSSNDMLSTLERLFSVAKGIFLCLDDGQALKDFLCFSEDIFSHLSGPSLVFMHTLQNQAVDLLALQG
ncbi:hypothetical protein FisN_31Lh063 [Fistulifera solaris]|uniref:Uncharacterized protein n=1 Tax=Fistulifera solaris TaxID=1519565 RepID=A0A1Z5K6A6_FISSO|nr:hypothetical protein FisN_31Lh063 [Fistulifera solaris]|eukprot:GAX21774.1 hypothetical protein FisN_31Lh063 [Fistulifera solaris]